MISTFFAWWMEQLTQLLPPFLRPSPHIPDALVVSLAGRLSDSGTVIVARRRRGREVPLGEFAAAAAELRDLLSSGGNASTVLRLEKREFLEKTLALPLAAQPDLDQVLEFEMDRETPFKAEELYWSRQIVAIDRQRRQLTVRLLLLPKIRLAPLLALLGSAGVAPAWAEVADRGDNRRLPLRRDAKYGAERSSRLLWAAALCCLILAVSAVAMPFVRQALVLGALDREVRAGREVAARAAVLRAQVERASRSADAVERELNKAGRPLEVLAKLTRILPDDTYLTELSLRQGKLTIGGRSGRAAHLIGALAADGGFRNPAFAAPVTRLEALHTEVFTIATDAGAP